LILNSLVISEEISLNSELNEEMLFENEVIISAPQKNEEALLSYADKKSINFTGQLDFKSYYSVNRDWLQGQGKWADNSLALYSEADLFLDVRLKKGIKAFMDLNILNFSQRIVSSNPLTTMVDFKEFFIDFNIDKKVYVRAGKQFIKWGRTYLWNPVDFINVEKRDFLDLAAIRTGTYGIRVYFPFSYDKNLYFFLNTSEAENLDDFALLTKYEFLLNNTEIGLSMWLKRHYLALYGIDLSTKLWGLDINSEIALSYGANSARMLVENGQLLTEQKANEWLAKMTLNVGKTFNWERADRIWLNYEIFYNGDGYDNNMLANAQQKAYLLANNLYTMNYLATWYHAMFITIKEFPTHSSTFSGNIMQNLVDQSMILFAGLNYQVTEGFSLGANVAFYLGENESEYLLNNNALQFQFLSTLTF
jgi:hypothetical protein